MTTDLALPSSREYLRLVLLGAVVGVPAVLVAAGFLALVHTVEHAVWNELPAALGASSPPWYLVMGLPLVGAALVVAARKLLPGDGGHPPLQGLSMAGQPLRAVPSVALAAFGTLVFGAVLGPEAPLIALGSAVGAVVAAMARVNPKQARLLTMAGAFSAVSALFGGPLVASFLLIEVGIAAGAALIPALLPGLVAAAIGYLIFVGLGNWGGLGTTVLSVPGLPAYQATHILDLVIAVVVGVVVAIVVGASRLLALGVAKRSEGRIAVPLFIGALCVGALAMIVRALGGDSQDVLFSGQASLPALVVATSVPILAILVVAKAIGYAICLGCGFRGGPVFPPIFIGIAAAMIPALLFDRSPTVAVAIGAAAGMAAATRLLFSPALFGALFVGIGGHDAVPPAILAAVAAWLTITAMTKASTTDAHDEHAVKPEGPQAAEASRPQAPELREQQ
jgi:H+/Cl- antiporter ClcA